MKEILKYNQFKCKLLGSGTVYILLFTSNSLATKNQRSCVITFDTQEKLVLPAN